LAVLCEEGACCIKKEVDEKWRARVRDMGWERRSHGASICSRVLVYGVVDIIFGTRDCLNLYNVLLFIGIPYLHRSAVTHMCNSSKRLPRAVIFM